MDFTPLSEERKKVKKSQKANVSCHDMMMMYVSTQKKNLSKPQ